jgi:micrococcal nuclease
VVTRWKPVLVALVLFVVVLVGGRVATATWSSLEAPGTPALGWEGPYLVEDVVDGDTIRLTDGSTVRLIGVDTPETVHPTEPVGCYGPEASAYTRSALPAGTAVELAFEDERTDHYGRLLAHVRRSSDQLWINGALVSGGYATTLEIAPNTDRAPNLATRQAEAEDARRGLWGAC